MATLTGSDQRYFAEIAQAYKLAWDNERCWIHSRAPGAALKIAEIIRDTHRRPLGLAAIIDGVAVFGFGYDGCAPDVYIARHNPRWRIQVRRDDTYPWLPFGGDLFNSLEAAMESSDYKLLGDLGPDCLQVVPVLH